MTVATILPQVPIVGGRPVIRRSLAEAILQCSHYEGDFGPQLAFGSAFHSFAASYALECYEAGKESLLTRVTSLAERAWSDQRGVEPGRWLEFLELCEKWAASHTADLHTLMTIEETLTLDVGWAILTCTLDRQDRIDAGDPDDEPTKIRVTDWKTELGEMPHEFQIWDYSAKRFATMPSLIDLEFVIDPVRQNQPYPPITFVRGQLDRWWDMTQRTLRARVFGPKGDPHGGPACENCRLRLECAASTAVARHAPQNDAEARALVEKREVLAAGLALADELLEQYTDGRAPLLDVAGRDAGWMTTVKPSFKAIAPASRVIEWAVETGRDIEAVVKPAAPTRRDEKNAWLDAGLAVEEFGPLKFTIRNHTPLRDDRMAAKTAEEGQDPGPDALERSVQRMQARRRRDRRSTQAADGEVAVLSLVPDAEPDAPDGGGA